ncbi:hypothetical protein [Bifidobacterium saguinibicoloris]|uniref:hypothetical protein n=1 Tax=Bifidobacterium saguinibicoloris TaxID=2834433 RepID=UPI001C568F5C|nr:hypothetical protein [Bifidobacterium saguinibicoloris]MBW3081298.1 hypothetical protein [Bifidobacterium saguinibicoloris]
MADGTVSKWNAKRGAMLGAQALAYVLLLAVGAVWGLGPSGVGDSPLMPVLTLLVMAAVLIAFHVCWPFRATLIDRAIGLIAGALSLAAAAVQVYGVYVPDDTADDQLLAGTYPLARWAAAVAGLLVVLTIVSFARQMLRKERSHLIRALSHCVTGGAASISLAGWFFIPYVTAGVSAGFTAEFGIIVAGIIAAMVVFAVVLAVSSSWWLRELDAAPDARAPWLGVAMLPVMFFGLVVFAAALLLQILA